MLNSLFVLPCCCAFFQHDLHLSPICTYRTATHAAMPAHRTGQVHKARYCEASRGMRQQRMQAHRKGTDALA